MPPYHLFTLNFISQPFNKSSVPLGVQCAAAKGPMGAWETGQHRPERYGASGCMHGLGQGLQQRLSGVG